MNRVLELALECTVVLIWIIWTYINYHEGKRLDARELSLERYAGDLDSWDTKLKTREVQITGIIRRDERLKGLRKAESVMREIDDRAAG